MIVEGNWSAYRAVHTQIWHTHHVSRGLKYGAALTKGLYCIVGGIIVSYEIKTRPAQIFLFLSLSPPIFEVSNVHYMRNHSSNSTFALVGSLRDYIRVKPRAREY